MIMKDRTELKKPPPQKKPMLPIEKKPIAIIVDDILILIRKVKCVIIEVQFKR